jgi:hypothetical protein
MKPVLTIFLLSFVIYFQVSSQTIQSPDEFLGYNLGQEFTFHHKALEYIQYVADNSPNAVFQKFGSSWEGRPLGVCFVSSEANLKNLETFRKNNLIKTGLLKGELTGKQIPFIWLSFNIHGNEATGMEAALKLIHTLVSGNYEGVKEWLEHCVIIIDPCQNPDGRDFYAINYKRSQNIIPNPDRETWEHYQAWPGTRVNHYLFDLNRDWIWQTQVETQQRLSLYNKYMPQVHADFHEMGPESSYFFPPGAEPWNKYITQWQREFHTLMGKGNAAMFDKISRLYFTKENYDLFSPAYGDTWPLFNGAMGFTYEQGGGGVAGLLLKQESGDTLSLSKRIEGHYTSALATIKVSFDNREKLLTGFNKYFEDNINTPSSIYKSFIIKGSNEGSNLQALVELCQKNQIKLFHISNPGKKIRGFDYFLQKETEFILEKEDILITAFQPQSRLIQVLFEPHATMPDSLTYDLTAWALPYIFNLKAYAVKEKLIPDGRELLIEKNTNEVQFEKPYAYIINFKGFNEIRFMSELHKKNIRFRYGLHTFSIQGIKYNRGSLVVARGDNPGQGNNLDVIITTIANNSNIKLHAVNSGMVESGYDLGSDYYILKKKPKAGIICGPGTNAPSVGYLWYFFEQELGYPVNLLNIENSERSDLSGYDIIFLASGNYTRLKNKIVDYVKKGGRVIAIDKANKIFSEDTTTQLYKTMNAKKILKDNPEMKDGGKLLRKYEDIERSRLSEISASSIYQVKIDNTHPYAFGMDQDWFIIKQTEGIPLIQEGHNIGYILDNEPVAGFAGYKFKSKTKNTAVIATEKYGSGEIIYISDEPYYRAFWKSGRTLLGNFIFR